jgi:hypothetical protein
MKLRTQLSPAKVNETTATEAHVTPTNTMTRSENYTGNTNSINQSEFKKILARILAKLDKLENKIEASDRESKERHEVLLSNLEATERES